MSPHVKFGRDEDQVVRDIATVFSEVIVVIKVYYDVIEVHVATEAARVLVESIRDDLRRSVSVTQFDDEHLGPGDHRMQSSDPRWRRGI